MKKILIPGLAVGSLILGAGSVEAAIFSFIDNFDTGITQIFLPPFPPAGPFPPDVPPISSPPIDPLIGSSITTGLLEENTLGGTRNLQATLTQNNNPFSLGSFVVGAGGGNLNVSAGSQANGNSLLIWDRNGAGLNADLSAVEGFQFDLISVNTGVTLTVTIDDGTNTSFSTVNFSGDATNVIERLRFNESTFPGIELVNLSSIDNITLLVEGPAEYDVTIDSLSTFIPEPSSIIGSVFVLGLGVFSTQRKKAKAEEKKTKIC